jgi:Mg-chelatase subunit ChlD
MKAAFASLALVLAVLGGAVSAKESEPTAQEKQKPPRVEVVFVLDTTGSMGGLLEGAKKKIWSISTEILAGKPKPDVFVGLVAYRDKGDAYVTRTTPLTDDLDKVYKELQGFQPGGGGDGPENVRAGLDEALSKIRWSVDKTTLKIVFLVGDAPAHTDYQDVPTLAELCKKAVESDVIINTVLCGRDGEAEKMWKDIARRSEGKFFAIEQTGGVVAVATPYDKELGELNDKLAGTMLAFGRKDARAGAAAREKESSTLAGDAKADRACAKAYAGRYSSDDLVDALKDGRADLAKIANDELPDEMQKMSAEERKAFVEKKAKEREELRAKAIELARKRDAFLAEAAKKRGDEKEGFDKVAVEALAEQAKKKGFEISCK